MDSPRLALRFRDSTPDIDTIAEHRRIIDHEGAVWWGWWRKEFEPEHRRLFRELEDGGPGVVIIVDRSTKRAFEARYLRATQDTSNVENGRLPEYYRAQKARVSGWFLLADIRDIVFDENLGRRLGEDTLLTLVRSEPTPVESVAIKTIARSHVLHLSDLHFGEDFAFLAEGETPGVEDSRQTLTRCLIDDLRRLGVQSDVGLVIATGDFTTRGDWSDATRNRILREMSTLLTELGLTREYLIALPGNHDVVRYPNDKDVNVAMMAVSKQSRYEHETHFRTFLEELTGRSWKEPLNYSEVFELDNVRIIVCALNSCTITSTAWTEYGYVGTGGLDVLSESVAHAGGDATLTVMALHHHLLPVTHVEVPGAKGVSLTLNAVELLDKALASGVQIVLHGHQHQARIASYGVLPLMSGSPTTPLVIVSGGSLGAKAGRLPGSERNTYSLFRIAADSVQLHMRELRFDAKEGATLYGGPLPIVPKSASIRCKESVNAT